MAPILNMREVTKRFPGVLANDRVSFSLNKGEILAFLGENGAGKSTLMNILYGLYSQDEGEIQINGKSVTISDPNDAIALGIGMVHQHFQLVPVFTVAENIVMGTEPTRLAFSWRTLALTGLASGLLFFFGAIFALESFLQWLLAGVAGGAAVAAFLALVLLLGILSRRGFRVFYPIVTAGSLALFVGLTLAFGSAGRIPLMVVLAFFFAAACYPFLNVVTTALDRQIAARRIRSLSEQYGLAIDPKAMTGDLPVGVQQRVEIIKTLYREAEILILDEPSAVLTPQETDELFEIMRSLTRQGKSIIFITHKLKEVMTIADRVVVLRLGRVVGEAIPGQSSEAELAEMMVGREVDLVVEKGPASPGEVVLEVKDLTAEDRRHQLALCGKVDFPRSRRRGAGGRRGARQWSDRIGRGPDRLAFGHQGFDQHPGPRRDPGNTADDYRVGCGTHSRGPPARRAGLAVPHL